MKLELDEVGLIEVVVGKEVIKADVSELCSINEDDLRAEFEKYPSKYAWWCTVRELYAGKRDDIEGQIKRLEASLYLSERNSLTDAELKTIKERDLDSRIRCNEKHKVLSQEFIDVKSIVRRLTALVQGLEKKGDMLIQIGARVRKEMELDKYNV